MSINSVNISGNLGRDPELRSTASGRQVCTFSVCVNDRRRKPGAQGNSRDDWEDVPNWVDVTFFGNRAESLARYLHKGSLVFVSGRIHQNTWEKDGQKRSKLEVIGSDIQFGSRQEQPQQNQPQYQQPQYAPQQQYQQPYQEQMRYAQQGDVYDEDIPF